MSLHSERVRSKTGCLTCKQRRKKCDETRPVCERCKKAGMNCLGYSYLDDANYKPTKRRSRAARLVAANSTAGPGPHDPSSPNSGPSLPITPNTAANLETHSSSAPAHNSLPLPLIPGVAQNIFPMADEQLQSLLSQFRPDDLQINDDAFDFSFLPSSQSGLPFSQLDGDVGGWGTADITRGGPYDPNLGQHSAGPSNLAFAAAIDHAVLSGSSTTSSAEPLLEPQYAGTDASGTMSSGLFNSFFSLRPPATERSSSTLAPSPLSSITLIGSQGSAWPSPNIKDDDEDSASSEESDPEGFKDVVLSTPALDSFVESNSLPFVLQSYANWFTRTVFEPLKLAHTFKGWITGRYTQSEDSRVIVMLFARMFDKLWTKGAPVTDSMLAASVLGQRIRNRAIEAGRTSRSNAEMIRALDEVMEMLHIQIIASPMSTFMELFTATAPLFRLACPEAPHEPIDLTAKLVYPQASLRHFASIDVMAGAVLSRPMLFRYHVQYDRALFGGILEVKDMGVQWMNGVPDQIVLILARMNMLREDFGPNVDPYVVAEIEQELREFKSSPGPTTDAYLMVARLGVQECWRLATFIYLYMGLSGANAKDPRVEKVHKSVIRLLERTKPGRTPDMFLIPALQLVGVATHRERERDLIHQRLLGLRECTTVGTSRHDALRALEDIWARTSAEGRPAVWSDLRISCARVLGL